jgi:N-dimethylarginine dimethylaminohydrolase
MTVEKLKYTSNKLNVSTRNEYGELKSVLLGSVEQFLWPDNDNEFENAIKKSTFPETLPRTSLPTKIIQEASDDLERFTATLQSFDVDVIRPKITKSHWAYSARDILLTVGNTVIECPTPFSSRSNELDLYPMLNDADCNIIRAPRPKSKNDPIFDAANVLKLDDKLLYSLSHSANDAGAEWLQSQVGTDFEVIKWKAVENTVTHIDSTLLSCAKNTIIVNASRLTNDSLPNFMQGYRKIWVNDCKPRDFYVFPYASKWIGMNVLSVNPQTIIVDEIQKDLVEQLRTEKFDVIELPMRQSRTLGGGFHCVTCDLERS